ADQDQDDDGDHQHAEAGIEPPAAEDDGDAARPLGEPYRGQHRERGQHEPDQRADEGHQRALPSRATPCAASWSTACWAARCASARASQSAVARAVCGGSDFTSSTAFARSPAFTAASARASLASTESPATSAPTRRSDTTLLSLPSRRCQKESSARSSAIAALAIAGNEAAKLAREATPLAATGCSAVMYSPNLASPCASGWSRARSVAKGNPADSAALIRAAMPITAEPRAAASAFCSLAVLAVAASVALSTEAFWPATVWSSDCIAARRAVISDFSAEVSAFRAEVSASGCGLFSSVSTLWRSSAIAGSGVVVGRLSDGLACAAAAEAARTLFSRSSSRALSSRLAASIWAVSTTGAEGDGGGAAATGPRHKFRASCGQ